MKEGIFTACIIALLLGVVLLGSRAIAETIEAEGRAQAAAITAEGQRAIDTAIARQMDAATAAVQADTRAAHSLAANVAPWSVTALGALVLLAVVGWQAAELRKTREQVATLAESLLITAVRREVEQ